VLLSLKNIVNQMMKDDGTLKKLIAISSDLAPPAEEKKTKGKEKEKAQAKGKKASAAEGGYSGHFTHIW
jgi:hypothetical protein